MKKRGHQKWSRCIALVRYTRLNRRYLTPIISVLFLYGCFAPALIPILSATSMALSGLQLYKGVQLTTGGSAEVRFKETKISEEDRSAVTTIKSIAVYPGSKENIALASELEEKSEFKIISPNSVRKAQKKGAFEDFGYLTEAEKTINAWNVCTAVGADSVLIMTFGGGGSSANLYSAKRTEVSAKIEIEFFSIKHKRKLWHQEGELVLKIGANSPAEDEVGELVASSVADKFMEVFALNPADISAPRGIEDSKQTESSRPSMTTMQIQQRLSELGYQPGPVDGKIGKNTIKALKKFQQDNNLPVTGKADIETVNNLR